MNNTSAQQRTTEKGQVMLIITMLMLGGSLLIVGIVASLVKSQVRVMSEQSFGVYSYAFAEGALEEVVYRYKNSMDVSTTETLTEDDFSATVVSTATIDGIEVASEGDVVGRNRTAEATLVVGSGASFAFGVQTGNGGFILENSSTVNGNVYSNGTVLGNHPVSKSHIYGTVISGGPTGFVKNIYAHDSVYAHTINTSTITGDAYYQSIDLVSEGGIGGIKASTSPDQATTSLPIADSMLDMWEEYASSSDVWDTECTAAGGTIVIDSDITLGPVKIPCDVEFEKFPEVTIQGVIWVVGDLEFTQGPEFTIDPAIGNKSVPIVVDNPADRLTSSRVVMENSGVWNGNGNRSYVLIVSRNESAEQGGGEKAITIKNSTGGALLIYTNHGEIQLENNTDLTMITAWRLRLQNLTEVNYDSGIASTLFETGPGGGYTIDSWREVE